jgi:hypothetical protein
MITTWTHQEGDKYLVTGIDREGKRFYLLYNYWHVAKAINVWKGSRWLIRDGKRVLIQRIYN